MVSSIQTAGAASMMRPMGPPPELTDDQKAQVQSILSKYNKSSVSTEDAKAIFQAFKDAGIKGPGLKQAIEEAGFDAEDLRTKAKPDWIPSPPADASTGNEGINVSALQSLQSILSQFDLTNLSTDQQSQLLEKLSQSGLLNTGYMINLNA
jgi:hypothetical protein